MNSITEDQAGVYRVIVSNPVGSVTSDGAVVKLDIPTDVMLSRNFADRVTLIGNPTGTARGDNTDAGVERTGGQNEPFHGGKKGGNSLWFTWRPQASGFVTVDTRGSEIDTLLGIYTGDILNDLRMVRDGDDHKDDDDDRGDDNEEDTARKKRTFFAESIRFEVVAGTDYHIAVDGYAGATGNVVVNWSFVETAEDLPKVSEMSGETAVGGGRRIVATLGSSVPLEVEGRGVALSFQWFHNGVRIPGATSRQYIIDELTNETVGEYQAQVSNQDGAHKVRSRKFLVEIGDDPNANTVTKLQDLNRNQGTAGVRGYRTPQNVIPVSAGALGTQVANNAESSTQQGELLIAGQLGGSSRWLQLKANETTDMEIDTTGSGVDTLLAVYTAPEGVPLDELQFNQLGFVESDDNSAPDGLRSAVEFRVTSGVNYLIAVDGKNGAKGELQINYRLGEAPRIMDQPVANFERTEGGEVTISVSTSGSPAPNYRWRFNGQDIDPVENPSAATATLTITGLELSHSGEYSVVVSNHMDSVTSSVATLTVTPGEMAPVITRDPQSQGACVGDTVVLTAAATGSPEPTWVWRRGTTILTGETGPTLTLSSVDSAAAGSYTAEAVNTAGSATSAAAVVTVGSAPTLDAAPPTFILVAKGAPVTLTAAATGETAFEWKLGDTVLGETGPTLTLPSVQPPSAGTYTVTAVNDCGRSVSAMTQIAIKHLSNPGFANGKFGFTLDGDPNDVWILEFAANGDHSVWTEAGRVTLDGSGVPTSATGTLSVTNGRVTDTASSDASGSRVYRMRKP